MTLSCPWPSHADQKAVSARTLMAAVLMLASAIGLPLSLLWDFAWESTVGVDLVWSPPHIATYAAMALGGISASLMGSAVRGVRVGKIRAPLGAWMVLWSVLTFVVATCFDRWWQLSYGLVAGIWHPPQLMKACAFAVMLVGAWCTLAPRYPRFVVFAAGALLSLLGVFVLTEQIPNRQHSASFAQISCAIYPLVLVATSVSARGRFPATSAAVVYTVLQAALVWLLPLIPGSPAVAPIYQPRDHLLPPPFPLLLFVPALAIDLLIRVFPSRQRQGENGWRSLETGVAFFILFVAVQWPFATFLLSSSADHWFFAGGGKEWPFFLKISPEAQTAFWTQPSEVFGLKHAALAVGLAILSARLGIATGDWIRRLQR